MKQILAVERGGVRNMTCGVEGPVERAGTATGTGSVFGASRVSAHRAFGVVRGECRHDQRPTGWAGARGSAGVV